jgi:hypothetical protein
MVDLGVKTDYGIPVIVCPYCNPPEAPIWMGDLSFKSLGDVHQGDEIIGWHVPERPIDVRPSRPIGQTPQERLCRTRVLDIFESVASLVEVEMESGRTFRCTPDHLWWVYRTMTDAPEFNVVRSRRTLRFVVDPMAAELTVDPYVAGYVAGIYDGDGGDLRIHQDPTANAATFERIGTMLDALKVSYTRSWDNHGSSVQGDFTLTGGRQGYLDFLWKTRPAKSEALIRHILTSCFSIRDRVVKVVPLDGSHRVIGLKTETGNYVAWGYASKNCDGAPLLRNKPRGNGDLVISGQ